MPFAGRAFYFNAQHANIRIFFHSSIKNRLADSSIKRKVYCKGTKIFDTEFTSACLSIDTNSKRPKSKTFVSFCETAKRKMKFSLSKNQNAITFSTGEKIGLVIKNKAIKKRFVLKRFGALRLGRFRSTKLSATTKLEQKYKLGVLYFCSFDATYVLAYRSFFLVVFIIILFLT